MRKRIAEFIADPEAEDFEDLATAALRFQAARIAPYAELCRGRGVEPEALRDYRRAPAVPTLAFKRLTLAAEPAVETFRSSGTGGERSVHHQPFPELYRAAIDASFPQACLGGLGAHPPMLSLVPGRDQAPDSSLAFMLDHVLDRWGGEGSVVAFGARGLERARARAWLAARQRDRRPALILATSFALAALIEALERTDLRFQLPAGSAVFETGGTKGRSREVERGELVAQLGERLGVPAERVVREYGMTELSSQFYTGALAGRDPDRFTTPHWTRVRILDPVTLAEVRPGRRGLISVLDLANLGSAVHVLTQDLGVAEAGGFRLAGRAAGAELRGCSLAVEELAGAARSPGA